MTFWQMLDYLFKMTKYSQRYKDTSTALDENHEVKHLITHSLGSSVGAQITKDYPERELTLTTRRLYHERLTLPMITLILEVS